MSDEIHLTDEAKAIRKRILEIDNHIDRLEAAQDESIKRGMRFFSPAQAAESLTQDKRQEQVGKMLAERSNLVAQLKDIVGGEHST